MSQSEGTNILIQGRIVWGSVKQRTKNVFGTNTPAIDPKTGKEIIEWVFGLAIPKASPQSAPHELKNVQDFWNAAQTEAAKVFPNGIPNTFKWKFVDGDGLKADGTKYPDHSKGCLVISCSTRIPLKLFAWEGNNIVQITDDQIKCGDYVQVQLNVNGHGGTNAGLYVNPSYVARVAHGQEIVNTPDPVTVFGTQAPAIPAGGSITPQAPQGAPMSGQVMQPQQQQQMQGMPMGGYQQPTGPQIAPQQPAQPNWNVLPPQMQPQQQQQSGTLPSNGMPQMPGFPGQR